jgi:predicted RNase H-like nuclease (RuvC/YqgF family)
MSEARKRVDLDPKSFKGEPGNTILYLTNNLNGVGKNLSIIQRRLNQEKDSSRALKAANFKLKRQLEEKAKYIEELRQRLGLKKGEA